MKQQLTLLILIAAFIHCTAQPVQQFGALKVKGTQLVGNGDKPVVLRGMSYGWHNWWPRFYNAETVQWLHNDWGCTIVRAAMGVEPDGGYIKDPENSKKHIKAVVDAAIKEGIYVIIDWHSHNINLNEAKAFFTEMATTYGQNPHVLYEIFNEPDEESWADVKSYSEEIIKTIRAIDPDNIILVGNPHWDQDIHSVADNPLTGFDNIMYTVHFYAATHKQWLRDRCEYALGKGIPIFVSESAGMEASGDGPLDMKEWGSWIEWMEKKQISWVVWSIADKNETCSVLNTSASSTGKWQTKDLKESGIKDREFLRKYNLKK